VHPTKADVAEPVRHVSPPPWFKVSVSYVGTDILFGK